MNIMKTMHLMQNKIEILEKEVASLKQSNISDPGSVESKNPSQNSSLSDAINEAIDIERHKYNLVISGMPICNNKYQILTYCSHCLRTLCLILWVM